MIGGLRLLLLPPWLRAPILLRRQPGVVLALMGASAILAVASSSGPLFLGVTGSAALARTAETGCSEAGAPAVDNPIASFQRAGITEGFRPVTGADVSAGDDVVRPMMRDAGLGDPEVVLVSTESAATTGGTFPVTLFSRSDALAHVEIVRGPSAGSGAWVSDRLSEQRGVDVGDELTVSGGVLPVVGIYRDLTGNGFQGELPEYWCTWQGLLVASIEEQPPPLVIVDLDSTLAVATALAATWYSPLRPDELTLSEAREVLGHAEQVRRQLVEQDLTSPMNPELGYVVRTQLDGYVERARQLSDGVRGPVLPIAVAATLIALLFVGGAGAFWVERRRPELRLLSSRGVGPVASSVKAGLELLPPIAAGSVIGWVLSLVLVRRLGPSSLIEPGSAASSGALVAVTALGALLLLGTVAGRQTARLLDVREVSAPSRWRQLPWELVLVLTALVVVLLPDDDSSVLTRGVAQVDASEVAFPLLALTGISILFCRLLAAALPALRGRTRRARMPIFLAGQRLGGAALISVGIVAFTAQPLGVFLYATAVTETTAQNLQDKSATYAGSENSLSIDVPPGSSVDVAPFGTPVSVLAGARWGEQEIQVLGVEPGTFARFAEDVTDGSLQRLTTRLGSPDDGGPAAGILVAPREVADLPQSVQFARDLLEVRVVETVAVFPGMRAVFRPMLVVDRNDLGSLDSFTPRQEEVWTTDDDLPGLLGRLGELGVAVDRVRTPETLLDATDLVTVTWSFGYLRALAVLTGLVGVCGLLLYLNIRIRRTATAYVLARRMGLSRRNHLASLATELAGVLGLAWVLGAAGALTTSGLAAGRLDVDSDFPPPPAVQLPVLGLIGSAAAVAVVVVLGALLAQGAADRVDAARALRVQNA